MFMICSNLGPWLFPPYLPSSSLVITLCFCLFESFILFPYLLFVAFFNHFSFPGFPCFCSSAASQPCLPAAATIQSMSSLATGSSQGNGNVNTRKNYPWLLGDLKVYTNLPYIATGSSILLKIELDNEVCSKIKDEGPICGISQNVLILPNRNKLNFPP